LMKAEEPHPVKPNFFKPGSSAHMHFFQVAALAAGPCMKALKNKPTEMSKSSKESCAYVIKVFFETLDEGVAWYKEQEKIKKNNSLNS
jgi:hypothetical protein